MSKPYNFRQRTGPIAFLGLNCSGFELTIADCNTDNTIIDQDGGGYNQWLICQRASK